MYTKERITISSLEQVPFKWSAGKFGSIFLRNIRDAKKFVGIKCDKCENVYVPPREICGKCYRELDNLIQLSTEGELIAYSIVNYKFIDPNTGTPRPVPYTYGYIKLDGADTTLSHFVNEQDPEKLYPGLRVRAVFKEERIGSLDDIECFEVISS